MFSPNYRLTNEIAEKLMVIQKASSIVELLPLPVSILDELRTQSRERTVILSTRIEGNTLDEAAARKALYADSKGDEEQELYNLMKALEFLDDAADRKLPITEELIKKLHAIIRVNQYGRRARISEYRREQNQVGVRNSSEFYLPPEWQDVPILMEDLVAWINSPETYSIPVPIKAGIFMWQFLTIHPYIDGNGRTARMLATYILRRGGFGLKGLFVLENFYDRNLAEYYRRLHMGLHHNYYFGRNDVDLTLWLQFFIEGLSVVFEEAAEIVANKSMQLTKLEPELIRRLDPLQRLVFTQLTFKQDSITTSELREMLHLSDRSIREKLSKWREEGFVAPRDSDAVRVRSIKLTQDYEQLAIEIRTDSVSYPYLLK